MAAANIDLEFQHVSKVYRIPEPEGGPAGSPMERWWRKMRPRRNEFRALNDIDFRVPRGQTLGIIGHNGAGKSTILKLLSNITTPTTGEIRIVGRIASLLEVGSGFHPELTGRENVYLSGSILGMRRAEISKNMDAIIDFAEVRKFIDVPTKRYSSGMFVRLGFSIAAHLDADILLLDEVLAVGDAAFQDRCLERIEGLRRAGVTIVFISHDLDAVRRLCERVLVVKAGSLVFDGSAEDAIRAYLDGARFQHAGKLESANSVPGRIKDVALLDSSGRVCSTFPCGAELRLRVEISVQAPFPDAFIEACVYDPMRQVICKLETAPEELNLDPGDYAVEFCCPALPLQSGAYAFDVSLECTGKMRNPDWQRNCASFYVERGSNTSGILFAPHHWRLERLGRHERADGAERVDESTLSDSVPRL